MHEFLVDAWTVIRKADAGLFAGAIFLYLLSIVISVLRWKRLLRDTGAHPPFRWTLISYLSSIFVNNTTPLSRIGGEATRIGLLYSKAKVPLKAGTMTAAFERISEIPAVLVLISLGGFVLFRVAQAKVESTWLVIGCIGSIFLVGTILFTFRFRIREKFHSLQTTFSGGHIRTSTWIEVITLSTIIWIQDVFRIWILARALNINLTLEAATSLAALAIVGGWVPTIGGLGAIEGGLLGGLALFGVPTASAMALTVLERSISYLLGTALGGFALLYFGGGRILSRVRRTQTG